MSWHWGLILLLSFSLGPAGLPCESHTIQKGETLWRLFRDEWKSDFVARLNGLEPLELQPGRLILVPTDWQLARAYAPLPEDLPDRRAEMCFTLIDLGREFLGMYESGRLVSWCRISTGIDERPTPTGSFKVLGKDINHESNLYTDRRGQPVKMPYAVWLGQEYWIHEGYLPGYPASHGCIRLRETDAKHFFAWARVGSYVLIYASVNGAG